MEKVRGILIALAAGGMVAAALPAPGIAQPPPPPAYYPAWQGWYAGGHLGYGEADGPDGFLGGVQAGYNWQSGPLIYGFEADVTWTDMNSSEHVRVCGGPSCSSARITSSIDWTATVRGRLGLLFQPSLMGYVTAGFGIVRESGSGSVTAFGVSDSFTFDDTDTDFVYGFGLEGPITPLVTLRVEYLGFNDTDIDVIRGALNLRFGP